MLRMTKNEGMHSMPYRGQSRQASLGKPVSANLAVFNARPPATQPPGASWSSLIGQDRVSDSV